MKLSIQYRVPEHLFPRCSELSGMEITNDPEEADAIIFGRGFTSGPDTRIFQCLYAGTDHLNEEDFPAGSIVLSNAGAYSEPVAETVFALILSHIKEVCSHNADYHNIQFNRRDVSTIYGKTLGIIGFGGIGRKVAEVARSFGMKVVAFTTHPDNSDDVEFMDSMQEVFAGSYAVVLSMPLKDATRNVIDRKMLESFRGSMIVNIARAEVVDRESMLEYLGRHPDVYFLTDVWWNEPDISGPVPENAIITPHIGGMGKEFLPVALERACINLRNYVEGRKYTTAFRR